MPDVYHLDTGVYIRINCNTNVSNAIGRYIMIKNEAGVVTQIEAEQDPYSVTHIRYLIPATGSPFATAPTGKDAVEYWLRPRIIFSSGFTAGQQGKPVLFTVGKSWSAT